MSSDHEGSHKDALRAGFSVLHLRAVQYIALFVAGLIVTRSLGPTGRAQYALSLTLVTIAWVVVHLSLDDVAGRLIGNGRLSMDRAPRVLLGLAPWQAVAGITVALAIGLPLRNEMLARATPGVVLLAAVLIPFLLANQALSGMLLRIGDIRAFTKGGLVTALVQVAVVSLLDLTGKLTPELALIALIAGYIGGLATIGTALVRAIGRSCLIPAFDLPVTREMLRGALGLHPGALANYINTRVDLMLVGALATARQAGLYSLSISLAELLTTTTNAITQAGIHRQTVELRDRAVDFTASLVRSVGPLVGAGTVLVAAGAYPFVILVYGPTWAGSVAPLAILCAGVSVLGLIGPLHILIGRIGTLRGMAAVSFVGCLVNVVGSLILIPAAGIVGAAIASVLSYWAYAVGLAVLYRRTTGRPIRSLFIAPDQEVTSA